MSVKVRQRTLKSGEIAFYIDVYHRGRRYVEATSLRAKKSDRDAVRQAAKAAELIASERQREMALDGEGLVSVSKRNADFIAFMEKLAKERGASRGYHNWITTLKHLKDYSNGAVTMRAVNVQWLEGFRSYLLSSNRMGQSTAHGYFAKVRAAIREAYKRGFLRENPAEKVSHIKQVQAKREFLSLQELERLAGTPCRVESVGRAFLFCCFTGLRFGDASRLTFGNIQDNNLYFVQSKTNESLRIPLSAQAGKIIEAERSGRPYTGNDAKVFILPSLTNVERALRDWATNAGIEKRVTFHVSRHTFATLTLTLGADLYTVSKLLGHKNIQTTQIYAKVVDAKKAEAVAALPLLGTPIKAGVEFIEH